MRLLYFASLRDRLGCSGEEVPLPPAVDTVSGLLDWLRERDPALAALDGRRVRVAVNQRFASPSDPVGADDEVALFPPVTGG
ncbi:MAG: molybdopterin converting factor subunit 1 [Gluconacetobacter diazotrophicus]|nr:molybdopterin converting factor subunit 1 [Gluconacetobacter diazotrophicus]